MPNLGKVLIVVGLVLVAGGMLLLVWPKMPFLGRLPGDIHNETDGMSFYFPLVTCLVLSLILTAVVNLVLWIIRRSG